MARKERALGRPWALGVVSVVTLAVLCSGFALIAADSNPDPVKQGEYIFRASGGCSCHTIPLSTNEILAGGRSLKTPFGALYSSNITPDRKTGIGSWSESDFIAAMRKGVRPDGTHLFPVFPYTSFTRIKIGDLEHLKAYLDTLPAVQKQNKPDKLMIPFKWRFGLFFWKLLNFREITFQPIPGKSKVWNRGAYLVTALAHCSECHSPRDISGGLKSKWLYSGSVDGPEGQPAPNITPDPGTGIGNWDKSGLGWFLQSGQTPEGDYTAGLMAEVINQGYQYLSRDDLQAMAEYIFDLPPIHNRLGRQ
jgi:mono/diheme cytochrome c family protein